MADLTVTQLSHSFGGVQALDKLTFGLAAGSVTAVIGPNGAGKTTLFNCISGLIRPISGSVVYQGREWVGRPSHWIARAGMARTFQNIALFGDLSLEQHLLVARHTKMEAGLWHGLWRWGSSSFAAREDARHREFIEGLIDLLELSAYRAQAVQSLSYGLQKRVELARALAAEPSLLLLDEPAAGLNLVERQTLVGWLRAWVSAHKITVLFIEHHMGLVQEWADAVLVLDFGRLIANGSPAEIAQHPEVHRAYLGRTQENRSRT